MINDELVLEIVLQVLEKYTEQQEQKEKSEDKITKTAIVPNPQTPAERVQALKNKVDSKWHSYIVKKLLPSLDKQ